MRRLALLGALLLALSLPAPRAVYADMFPNAANADQPEALQNLTNQILTLSGGVLRAGSGTNFLYGTGDPQVLAIYKGTVAAPLTAAGQQIKIVVHHAVTKDKCFNNSADANCIAPLVVQVNGLPTTTMGTTAAYFYAVGSSPLDTPTDDVDVTGLGAQADIKDAGAGQAMGAYLVARKYNSAGRATGAEISAGNYSNTDTCLVSNTGLGKCIGIWVAARGNNAATPLASAVQIGTAAAVAGEVGRWTQGITVNTNAFGTGVTGTRTFADYSDSEASLYVRGNHSYALLTDTTAGSVGFGTLGPTAKLEIAGNFSSAFTTTGTILSIRDLAITDTTSSGTVATLNANRVGVPILRATNATTYTEAATLTIGACPTADTNVTITRCYGLKVGGKAYFLGEIEMLKASLSGVAPGANLMKLAAAPGTTAGTCKLVAYAGTSTTPVTIIDNVGAGC